jgi:hypothetical protein
LLKARHWLLMCLPPLTKQVRLWLMLPLLPL